MEAPYEPDKRHWLYFGWENDHPKALSFMGGGLIPRRAKAEDEDAKYWEHTRGPHNSERSEIILPDICYFCMYLRYLLPEFLPVI